MATSEEQKQADPVQSLLEYIKNYCDRYDLNCYVTIVKMDGCKKGVGCLLNGRPSVLIPSICEIMDKDSNITRLHEEVHLYAKSKKIISENNLEDIIKKMMG